VEGGSSSNKKAREGEKGRSSTMTEGAFAVFIEEEENV